MNRLIAAALAVAMLPSVASAYPMTMSYTVTPTGGSYDYCFDMVATRDDYPDCLLYTSDAADE